MNYWTQSEKNIYVAAHRGWADAYPPNTMEAFLAAEKLGVDQIETDVRVSKDGVLVLIHDETVDATTNGTGLVREKTLEELRQLDAGSYMGEQFSGCKIPTLEEFLEHFKDHPTMTLDIELKEYPEEGRDALAFDVCDRALAMIDQVGYTDRVVINVWNAKLHEYIQRKYGNKYRQHVYFPVHYMGETEIDPYSYGYCCCMFPENEQETYMASLAECEKMRARGVQTWAGAGVHDEEGVKKAIAHGASLITCNNPDEILAILRRLGYHK